MILVNHIYIYIYIHVNKVGDRSRGNPKPPFQYLLHQGVGEGATYFP